KDGVGARSGVSPVAESLKSQKKWKVRSSRVSRNAVARSLSGGETGAAVDPEVWAGWAVVDTLGAWQPPSHSAARSQTPIPARALALHHLMPPPWTGE